MQNSKSNLSLRWKKENINSENHVTWKEKQFFFLLLLLLWLNYVCEALNIQPATFSSSLKINLVITICYVARHQLRTLVKHVKKKVQNEICEQIPRCSWPFGLPRTLTHSYLWTQIESFSMQKIKIWMEKERKKKKKKLIPNSNKQIKTLEPFTSKRFALSIQQTLKVEWAIFIHISFFFRYLSIITIWFVWKTGIGCMSSLCLCITCQNNIIAKMKWEKSTFFFFMKCIYNMFSICYSTIYADAVIALDDTQTKYQFLLYFLLLTQFECLLFPSCFCQKRKKIDTNCASDMWIA